MIPFILTIVGGYLIGDSMKESSSDEKSYEYNPLKLEDGGKLKNYQVVGKVTINQGVNMPEADPKDYMDTETIDFEVSVMASSEEEAERMAEQEVKDKYLLDDYGTWFTRSKQYSSGTVEIEDVIETGRFAKGGKTDKPNGKFKVFNYTDNIYATDKVFKTEKEAKDFIKEFRKRFEKQGYYRDNRWNQIAPEHIDLEVIPENFGPFTGEYFEDGGNVDDELNQLQAKKEKLKDGLLDASMSGDMKKKKDIERQLEPINSKINELLKKKYGWKKMADGGDIKSQWMNARFKIASIIGVDKALRYLERDYSVSPFSLIQSAVSKGFITIDEINEDVWDAAVSEAEQIDEMYKDSGQGISSSDMNAFISSMLNDAGIKIIVVNNRYERADKFADGGNIAEQNNRMLRSKTKEIKHHADELGKLVKPNTTVDAWVVSKAERSASDLSDITHFLDGKEFADGGMMADGGEISLWKIGGGTAEKLKTGSHIAIQSFLTKNKYKGLQWGDWGGKFGLQSWPADATKEEVEKHNESHRRTATDQEYAKGGKVEEYELIPIVEKQKDGKTIIDFDESRTDHFSGTERELSDKIDEIAKSDRKIVYIQVRRKDKRTKLFISKFYLSDKLEEGKRSLRDFKMADGGKVEEAAKRKADNPNWTNEKLLAEYNSLTIDLEDLKEGKITPRRIIGGGYKSSAVAKKIAREWLENQIAEFKMALEMRGVMADGGKTTEHHFVLGVMKNEKIGGKDFLVSGKSVGVTGTMKDAEEKAKELLKEGAAEVNISKYNDKGRLGKVLKTIK